MVSLRRLSQNIPPWAQALPLALIAVVVGLALAGLPLMWASILLVVTALVVLTIIDPLAGLGAALILGPTKPATDFFIPALPLDLGQIALLVTLGAWFLHAARDKRLVLPRSPLTVPLLLYITVAGLSLLNALSFGAALTELLKWGQMLIVVWIVVLEARTPARLHLVIGLVLAAAAVQALVGVWQFGLRGDGPEHFQILGGEFYRAYGSFEQPNPFGGFLGLTLPLAIGLTLGALEAWAHPLIAQLKTRELPRIPDALNPDLLRLAAFGALAALLLTALLMSWSRGAWLGFAVAAGGVLVVWPRKTWLGVGLAVVALVIGAAALQFDLLPASLEARLTGFTEDFTTLDVRGVDINDANYSVLERIAHWQAAWEMARYNPWLGVGIGNYEVVYPAYALLNWPDALGHAHNVYLNVLAETGLLGLAAYLGLWGCVVWFTWRTTRADDLWTRSIAIGLFGVWVHLSAHHMLDKLYVANLHLHIGVLLGVLSILWRTRTYERRSNDTP